MGSQEQDEESDREGTWWPRCTLGIRQGANHCRRSQVHQGVGKVGGWGSCSEQWGWLGERMHQSPQPHGLKPGRPWA